jgi:hypothetical protein
MKEIFANGAIGDETRERVKVDKAQRIQRGQFRRRLSCLLDASLESRFADLLHAEIE